MHITSCVNILELAEHVVALHVEDEVGLGHHALGVAHRLEVSKISISNLNAVVVAQQKIFRDGDLPIVADICFVEYLAKSCKKTFLDFAKLRLCYIAKFQSVRPLCTQPQENKFEFQLGGNSRGDWGETG